MQQQTTLQKAKVGADLLDLLRECTPGTHAWGLITHRCLEVLMTHYIHELENKYMENNK